MIGEEQHEAVMERGLNLSGLVRDLLNDYLSENKIVIAVSDETKQVYDQVVSNSGASDEDLEPYLMEALKGLLEERIQSMEKLRKKLIKKGGRR
ncbi:MAG: hypothetical protein CL677_06760 [Bdellovibrionaceae bacterium]|nr:hypothetical protein [Pseudobdellovibrionaceae bacterium]